MVPLLLEPLLNRELAADVDLLRGRQLRPTLEQTVDNTLARPIVMESALGTHTSSIYYLVYNIPYTLGTKKRTN
jgi:hypothetical protein